MLAKDSAIKARSLISDGKTDDAIDLLLCYFEESKDKYFENNDWSKLYNRVGIISAQSKLMANDISVGLYTHEQTNAGRNRLNQSVFDLIEELVKLEADSTSESNYLFQKNSSRTHSSIDELGKIPQLNEQDRNNILRYLRKLPLGNLIDKILNSTSPRYEKLNTAFNSVIEINNRAWIRKLAGEWMSENGQDVGFEILSEICEESNNYKYLCRNETIKLELKVCIEAIVFYTENKLSRGKKPNAEKLKNLLRQNNVLKRKYYYFFNKLFGSYILKLKQIHQNGDWDRDDSAYVVLVDYFETLRNCFPKP